MSGYVTARFTRAQALAVLVAIGYKQEACEPDGDGAGITESEWKTLERGEFAILRAYHSATDPRHPDHPEFRPWTKERPDAS